MKFSILEAQKNPCLILHRRVFVIFFQPCSNTSTTAGDGEDNDSIFLKLKKSIFIAWACFHKLFSSRAVTHLQQLETEKIMTAFLKLKSLYLLHGRVFRKLFSSRAVTHLQQSETEKITIAFLKLKSLYLLHGRVFVKYFPAV